MVSLILHLGLISSFTPAVVGSAPAGTAEAEATALGSRLELFLDHSLIEWLEGATLELGCPRDEGMALRFDQHWEFPYAGCATVIKHGAKYILIYRGMNTDAQGMDGEEFTCYAESMDGIQWIKPDLGLYEVNGTRKNNIILAREAPFSHNFTPFVDERPGVPANQRFKAVAGTLRENIETGKGLFVFASPDAIHWEKLADHAVITKGAFDSQNVAFWSEHEQKYLCYFRTFRDGFRWVSRVGSSDFVHWDEPVEMMFIHGTGPAPREHIYTNGTQPYFRAPHLYIGLPFRLVDRTVISDEQAKALGVMPDQHRGCSEPVLMSSRGGRIYDRTFLESFLRPAIGPQNWIARANMPAYGVVPTGPDEMSLYVLCSYAQPTVHLRRYSLRLDGFASLHAGYRGGEMLTRPITFEGKRLILNVSTAAAGSLRVEILGRDRVPIPGFGLNECQPITGNETHREVLWQQGADVSSLAGTVVRLRFALQDADLYSFRFK